MTGLMIITTAIDMECENAYPANLTAGRLNFNIRWFKMIIYKLIRIFFTQIFKFKLL